MSGLEPHLIRSRARPVPGRVSIRDDGLVKPFRVVHELDIGRDVRAARLHTVCRMRTPPDSLPEPFEEALAQVRRLRSLV